VPSWAAVTSPSPGGLDNFLNDVVVLSAADAWTVGGGASANDEPVTVAEHWDGSAWTVSSTPNVGEGANYLYGVAAASSSDVWAVGTYVDVPTNRYRTLTLHYTGGAWSLIPSPNIGTNSNFLLGVEVVSATDVWAVGYALDDISSVKTLILHYNGTSWSIVTSPNPAASGNYLYAVSATASNDIWAVGATYVASATNLQTMIVHYNGTSWSTFASPNRVANTANLLLDVDATSSTQAWAVGFANGTEGFERIALKWNGTTWTLSQAANGAGKLFAVASVSSGDVWAAGATGLIQHWDGLTWQVVSAPSDVLMATYFGIAALPGGQLWSVGFTTPQGQIDKTMSSNLCEAVVNDAGFSLDSAPVPLGSTTTWTFPSTNLSTHRVRDAQKLGLFDSGLRSAGTSYTFTFSAAGTYSAGDTVSADRMQLTVKPTATPASGGVTTEFTITWATGPVAGFLFDVQIRRPGSSWADWKTGVTALTSTFTPDAGTGQYSFRARIRNATSGKASQYSPAVTITVN
jgi:plastocyanin